MAKKSVYTSVCLFLLLAAFVQCGLGQGQTGSISIFNAADYDMLIQKTVKFYIGGSTTDPVYSPLPKGTSFNFQVLEGMFSVSTSFKMNTPSGQYSQSVEDWCQFNGNMPFPCTPDCFWIVDDSGFSVGNSEHSPMSFVTGWNAETVSG